MVTSFPTGTTEAPSMGQKPFLPIATGATVMPWAVILIHASRGESWTFSIPHPQRRRSGTPHPSGEAAWAVFFSCFLPPLPTRLGERAVCFCVEPVWLRGCPDGPIPSRPCKKTISGAPEPPLLPRSLPAGGPGRGRGPDASPDRAGGSRSPSSPLDARPLGVPWPCHPSASPQPQSRAALPQDGLPGRARADGRGKRCGTHLVSPSPSCATRHRVPRDETASSSRTGTVKNSRQKD